MKIIRTAIKVAVEGFIYQVSVMVNYENMAIPRAARVAGRIRTFYPSIGRQRKPCVICLGRIISIKKTVAKTNGMIKE